MWLDMSVLVSLYVPEPRSVRVARLVRHVGDPILFSQLRELEVVTALRLRLFRREAGPRRSSQSRKRRLARTTDFCEPMRGRHGLRDLGDVRHTDAHANSHGP